MKDLIYVGATILSGIAISYFLIYLAPAIIFKFL